jgi:hypothetical protein
VDLERTQFDGIWNSLAATRTMIARTGYQYEGVSESLAQTQEIIAKSREILDRFYANYDALPLMICLLCDYEAKEMHRLKFRDAAVRIRLLCCLWRSIGSVSAISASTAMASPTGWSPF